MGMTKFLAVRSSAVLMSTLFVLTGCLSEPAKTPIVVEQNANQNMALSVDFVSVDSPELADHILNNALGGWFENKAAYMTQYGDRLAVHHYQFAPGQWMPEGAEWPSLEEATPIYLIAGHFVAGPRVLKVEPARLAGVTIAADDIVLNFK